MKRGIPPPERYYVSPMDRCIQTARISFEELDLPVGKEFRPAVKEVSYFPVILFCSYSSDYKSFVDAVRFYE